MSFQSENLDRSFKGLVLIALVVALFYIGSNILFPILFALFVVLALKGVMDWFDKKRVPLVLSSLLMTVAITLTALGVITLLVIKGVDIGNDVELQSQGKTLDNLQHIVKMAEDKFNLSEEELEGPIKSGLSSVLKASGNVLSMLISGIQSTLLFISLIPLYVFFMLMFRPNANAFISSHFDFRKEKQVRAIIDEISQVLRRYVLGLLLVILVVGTLNSIGLAVIGLKHAVFLGLGTALLMVIPYIGVLIGAIVPTAMALLTLPSPWYALAVLSMYIVIQFIEGNIITPKVVGGAVNLNSLTIIIGMLVLGIIGGTLGLVLAIPLLSCIRILLSHSGRYKSFALLMGNV